MLALGSVFLFSEPYAKGASTSSSRAVVIPLRSEEYLPPTVRILNFYILSFDT